MKKKTKLRIPTDNEAFALAELGSSVLRDKVHAFECCDCGREFAASPGPRTCPFCDSRYLVNSTLQPKPDSN